MAEYTRRAPMDEEDEREKLAEGYGFEPRPTNAPSRPSMDEMRRTSQPEESPEGGPATSSLAGIIAKLIEAAQRSSGAYETTTIPHQVMRDVDYAGQMNPEDESVTEATLGAHNMMQERLARERGR